MRALESQFLLFDKLARDSPTFADFADREIDKAENAEGEHWTDDPVFAEKKDWVAARFPDTDTQT